MRAHNGHDGVKNLQNTLPKRLQGCVEPGLLFLLDGDAALGNADRGRGIAGLNRRVAERDGLRELLFEVLAKRELLLEAVLDVAPRGLRGAETRHELGVQVAERRGDVGHCGR